MSKFLRAFGAQELQVFNMPQPMIDNAPPTAPIDKMVRGAESILDQTDLPREYIAVGILKTPVANLTKITKGQTNLDIEG
jgi:hypothetical protein